MANSINFSGLASGIDTKAIIEAILRAESKPLEKLQSRQATFNARKTALEDLRSRLDKFETKLRDLGDRSFRASKATVSDETVLRATPGTSAEPGIYTIEVLGLAAAQKNKSDGFAAPDQGLVADGTLTIQSGANDPITVNVSATAGNNSLRSVRDAINAADAGVTASVLFDGAAYRLVVRSEKSGTSNALQITDTTGLNLDDAANVVAQAADASLRVDGIAVTSSSNAVTDVIPGVTLDLLSETEAGQSVTVEVAPNTDGVVSSVRALLDAYNEVTDFLNAQFDRDKPGALAGDATARRVQQQVQALMTDGVEGLPLGSASSLASVGVSFDGKTGRATLDTAKLQDLLKNDFASVANLFAQGGIATDARVSFVAGTGATSAGSYDVRVTQAAEAATVAGSAAWSGGVLGREETLTIDVGGTSVNVALTSGQTLAQAVDALNAAFRSAELGVTARADAGSLRFTTRDYGSAVALSVTSDQADPGDGSGTGFGTTAVTDTGLDVAGTIGGVAATGKGQILTGAAGGGFEGLAVRITATPAEVASLAGNFGSFAYSRGLVRSLTTVLDDLTRFDGGTIDIAKKSLEASLKTIALDIERFNDRLDIRQARLTQTFAAAEKAISILQSQQNQFASAIR